MKLIGVGLLPGIPPVYQFPAPRYSLEEYNTPFGPKRMSQIYLNSDVSRHYLVYRYIQI
jgi:hypothetical protein